MTFDPAQPISACSPGMKQKPAIISAFVHEPGLLLRTSLLLFAHVLTSPCILNSSLFSPYFPELFKKFDQISYPVFSARRNWVPPVFSLSRLNCNTFASQFLHLFPFRNAFILLSAHIILHSGALSADWCEKAWRRRIITLSHAWRAQAFFIKSTLDTWHLTNPTWGDIL